MAEQEKTIETLLEAVKALRAEITELKSANGATAAKEDTKYIVVARNKNVGSGSKEFNVLRHLPPPYKKDEPALAPSWDKRPTLWKERNLYLMEDFPCAVWNNLQEAEETARKCGGRVEQTTLSCQIIPEEIYEFRFRDENGVEEWCIARAKEHCGISLEGSNAGRAKVSLESLLPDGTFTARIDKENRRRNGTPEYFMKEGQLACESMYKGPVEKFCQSIADDFSLLRSSRVSSLFSSQIRPASEKTKERARIALLLAYEGVADEEILSIYHAHKRKVEERFRSQIDSAMNAIGAANGEFERMNAVYEAGHALWVANYDVYGESSPSTTIQEQRGEGMMAHAVSRQQQITQEMPLLQETYKRVKEDYTSMLETVLMCNDVESRSLGRAVDLSLITLTGKWHKRV